MHEETDRHPASAQLPPGLAQAWGLRERPARGPRRGLTVEQIVAAGVAVAERAGLAAVSMASVAKEVGASPMGLYRYVASKDELLDLMYDTGMGAPPPLPGASAGWRSVLTAWTTALFERSCARPWTTQYRITAPPLTPNNFRWMEAALRGLVDLRLPEQDKLTTMLVLSTFARSQAALAIDMAEGLRRAGEIAAAAEAIDGDATVDGRATGPREDVIDRTDALTSYSVIAEQLLDPREFPATMRALASGALDGDEAPGSFTRETFDFGLALLLDGVERRLAGPGAPAGRA